MCIPGSGKPWTETAPVEEGKNFTARKSKRCFLTLSAQEHHLGAWPGELR